MEFFLDSYKDPNKTESKTVNALYNYPKEIADIIFSKSKDFPNNTQLSIAIIINDKRDKLLWNYKIKRHQ